MKYQGFIITTTHAYVSNETGEIVDITSEQALLDNFQPEPKYSFIQLCEKLGTLEAKTLRDLDAKAYEFAAEKNFYDFSVFVKK